METNLANRVDTAQTFDEMFVKGFEFDDKVFDKILIRSIMSEIREWAEHIDQLSPYPTNDLGGMCAIASGRLWQKLMQAGINAEIHLCECDWYAHVYVVVDDYVLDVTATQFKEFRNQSILYIHKKEAEAYEFFNTTQVFKHIRELIAYQKKLRWPIDQRAYE